MKVSKTDKTRPPWVKSQDRPAFLVDEHDHRNGVCDLPAKDSLDEIAWSHGGGITNDGRCRWVYSTVFWRVPENYCGCKMCTQQIERKAKARRSRQEGRRQARDWQKEM